jgi:hypothetical protein
MIRAEIFYYDRAFMIRSLAVAEENSERRIGNAGSWRSAHSDRGFGVQGLGDFDALARANMICSSVSVAIWLASVTQREMPKAKTTNAKIVRAKDARRTGNASIEKRLDASLH